MKARDLKFRPSQNLIFLRGQNLPLQILRLNALKLLRKHMRLEKYFCQKYEKVPFSSFTSKSKRIAKILENVAQTCVRVSVQFRSSNLIITQLYIVLVLFSINQVIESHKNIMKNVSLRFLFKNIF